MIENLSPQTLAVISLALRVVATILIGAVIIKQIQNMRRLTTDYPAVRITVFLLTLTLLIGQIIPITIDSIVVFTNDTAGRLTNPNALSYVYSINNAVTDVVIGVLLVFLHFRVSPPKKNKETGI